MNTEQTDFYREFWERSVLLPDLDISLVEITGEDRLDWLNGQATNDLRSLVASSPPISFCLCEATGQLRAVCDVWSDGVRLLVATDSAGAAYLLDRAEKMVILEDVAARDLTPDFHLRSLHGPISGGSGTIYLDDFWEMNEWQGYKPVEEIKTATIGVRHHRFGVEGWDLWIRNGFRDPYGPFDPDHNAMDFLEGLDSDKDEEQLPRELLEIIRIECGIPLRGVDYTEKTLPPELGPAFEAKYISYNKGCYTGQEVLMRMHSRGHTNKTWVGILLDSPVTAGMRVSHESREDAGVITSAAVSPKFGPIAAAMLRNEAAQEGAEVKVGDIKGRVRQMPLRRD